MEEGYYWSKWKRNNEWTMTYCLNDRFYAMAGGTAMYDPEMFSEFKKCSIQTVDDEPKLVVK